jgi:hypothetical protein
MIWSGSTLWQSDWRLNSQNFIPKRPPKDRKQMGFTDAEEWDEAAISILPRFDF